METRSATRFESHLGTAAATRDHGDARSDHRLSKPRVLIGLEAFTGIAGVAGGLLLSIRPDGSLLMAKPSALVGSPFDDYRVPGILLALLVGVGFLVTSIWQWRSGRHARELSLFAGAGLIAFEAAEFAWLGFQPLQVVFALVGGLVFWLALRFGSKGVFGDVHDP